MNKFKFMVEVDDPKLAADLFWATKIVKNDDPTKFISYANIKNGVLTVTDKNRIHRVTGLDKDIFINGNYAIIVCSSDRICLAIPEAELKEKIPNFDSKFENGDPAQRVEFICSNNKVTQALEYAKLIRNFPKPTTISYDFVQELGASEDKYSVAWYSPEKPVMFSLENKVALILPIRME